MEENYVQFTMRMEKNLYEQLKESAIKNRRSIAKELEHITDDALNNLVPVTLPKEIAEEFLKRIKQYPNENNI